MFLLAYYLFVSLTLVSLNHILFTNNILQLQYWIKTLYFHNLNGVRGCWKSVEDKVSKLSYENRIRESELELEESNLTKIRKTISKLEFDILAIEFDEKVKKIRIEQADKQRKINVFLNENRKLFFEKVTPILLDYINELGIEVLLNKDTVALASLGSDITKSAINRINEQLND